MPRDSLEHVLVDSTTCGRLVRTRAPKQGLQRWRAARMAVHVCGGVACACVGTRWRGRQCCRDKRAEDGLSHECWNILSVLVLWGRQGGTTGLRCQASALTCACVCVATGRRSSACIALSHKNNATAGACHYGASVRQQQESLQHYQREHVLAKRNLSA